MTWWPDMQPEHLAEIDVRRPNPARMYDYYLGGSANFESDRTAAQAAIAALPDLVPSIRSNRAFLGRVVRFCLERGIDQFLDLGSGIPTVGHVHEVAHRFNPVAKVAYVDNDPVAVAHGSQLLRDNKQATVTEADIRDVSGVLRAETVSGMLDLDRPMGLMVVSVLNFLPDDAEAREVLHAYAAAPAPGSYLAFSHPTPEFVPPEAAERTAQLYGTANPPAYWRSAARIAELVEGLDLVEPGLVPPSQWRQYSTPPAAVLPEREIYLAAVAALT